MVCRSFRPNLTEPLVGFRQALLARRVRCAQPTSLWNVTCEVREVCPSLSKDLPDARQVAEEFLDDLRLNLPIAPRPALKPIDMNTAEMLLWTGLVGGLVCEAGAFDAQPHEAEDWVTRLLVTLADDGGIRCFHSNGLYDPCVESSAILALTPKVAVLVAIVGWD